MERQPKIDLVIKAIEKAKAITPKGQQVKVYLSKIINQVRLEELQNILTILEDDEKILTLMRFPRHLLKLPPGYEYTDMLTGEKSSPSTEYFTVVVKKKFDKWCTQYWADKDSIDIITCEKAERLVLDAMKIATISQQDLDTLSQYANDDPEGFLDILWKIGRSPVLDGLMKRLSPECTPEDLEEIFNPQPPSLADSKVRRRKPSWTKTNVPWEIKKVIWRRWAKGNTITDIQRFLELNRDKYADAPLDRKTISKVMDELCLLSASEEKTLITELPEVSSLIQEQKANLKTKPK